LYLVDSNNEIVNSPKDLNKILDVFSFPTFKNFREQYFTHYFCAGELYFFNRKNVLGEIKCQILDNRTMTKKVDDY
jgi:hypothetical protein